MGGFLTSCEDRMPQDGEGVEHHIVETLQQSEVDQVKTIYNGEVALIDVSSENLMPYFQKRLPNTTNNITEHTDVVLLSEQGVNKVLTDSNLYQSIQQHWKRNKPVGVLSPSENTLNLIAKFNGVEESKVEKEDIESIERYAFYMLKADGNAVSYCKLNVDEVMIQLIDSNGVEFEAEKLAPQNIEVSDYAKGKVAERAAEWLNTSQTVKKRRSLSSSLGDVSYEAFTQKFYKLITVDHNYIVDAEDYGTGCGNSTTEAVVELKVYAGFDPTTKQDVYDMIVTETFDASRSYLENKIVKEYGLYKNKYTGGNYAGVTVGLRLNNVMGSDISFTDAVPVATAGSYTTSYTPACMTVDGGIGTDASSGLGTNLCFSYTPPATSVIMAHEELPVQYNDNHTWVEWDYGIKELKDYPQVYDIDWGFNPDFISVFGFSKGSSQTQQAVTYKVSNTEKYEGQPVTLMLEAMYKTYHEVASPFSGMCCYMYHYTNFFVSLPQVCRHFEKYSPYCYAQDITDNTETWENVENILKSNVNYKIFYNDNLTIGSPLSDGVDDEASKIWQETINSIINQFGGHRSVKNKYLVALADSKGNALKMGLYIDGDTWSYVNDITKVEL